MDAPRMLRRRLLACAGGLSSLWLGGWPARAAAQADVRRIALVIGNARYAQAALDNPENDARLLSQTMRSLQFEVTEHLNLKGRDFRRVLRDFARRLDDEDSAAVFFYAGHGMQIDRRNYLLPVDLNLRDEDEVRDESIDIEDALLGRIKRLSDYPRIFIIDACRDNPFAGRTNSVRTSRGLAEMAAPGALIAFAAAPGRTAEDGPPGGNSVYSRHLAAEMLVPGIEVEEMFKNVRIKVLRETNERQIPWVNTSMVSNFVFRLVPGGTAVAALTRPPAAASPPAAAGKRSLRLMIQAGRELNTDSRQASASLALRIYLLRDAQGFQNASFDNLYDNDEATLGATLLTRESVFVRPGESRELSLELAREVRAVGVLAAYRELERAQWRAVLPLTGDDVAPIARLDALARQVKLGWAR
jgi:type VI secretion system VasD/TssJ family lipoprotein